MYPSLSMLFHIHHSHTNTRALQQKQSTSLLPRRSARSTKWDSNLDLYGELYDTIIAILPLTYTRQLGRVPSTLQQELV